MIRTRVGYAGGTKKNPTYRDMGDQTECFQVDFDPAVISFEDLVQIFWKAHNPCGGGGSRQYMSILFYGDDGQQTIAEDTKAAVEQETGSRVRTALLPLGTFTLAEDYHQKYRLRHEKALMAEFRAIYPNDADFVNSTAAARVNAWLSGEGTKEQMEEEIGRLGLSAAAVKALRASVRHLPSRSR